MKQDNLESWATVLNEARRTGRPIPQIGPQVGEFRRPDAYSIQELQQKTRLSQGEKQVGWKMGLTSEAKRRQMNLDSPLYGFLTDRMQVADGGVFSLAGTIHPKIEPEVAFLITKPLRGQVSREDALAAIGAVAACMEILDSRYEQFKYFSMEDVISDNSSSSHFVVGPWLREFKTLDLKNLEMDMRQNGSTVQKGISSDISGDPVVSLIQLCQLLAERNRGLQGGEIILAGAATTAVELQDGQQFELSVTGLPPVSVSVSRGAP